jgi:hypothetical protein
MLLPVTVVVEGEGRLSCTTVPDVVRARSMEIVRRRLVGDTGRLSVNTACLIRCK